jgi:glutathione S-transferase
MHSGFSALRSALPMNLKAHFPGFKVWSRANADIARVTEIWNECLAASGGPFLFGQACAADFMYAPVVTRLLTYDVTLDNVSAKYCQHIISLPYMQEWIAAAKLEPDDIDELEAEF